jgi:uncharacterized protein YndB with AHSA1/START domain
MRRVRESIRLPQAPGEVWEALTQAGFAKALTEELSGGAPGCSCVLSGSPDGRALGRESEAVVSRMGREWVRWRVSAFEPGRLLVLALPRRSCDAAAEFLLEPLAEGGTEVRAALSLVLRSQFLEALTLALPARWLYAGKLRRALKRLQGQCSSR